MAGVKAVVVSLMFITVTIIFITIMFIVLPEPDIKSVVRSCEVVEDGYVI